MAYCPAREQSVTPMSPEGMRMRQALLNSYIAAVFCIALAGFLSRSGQVALLDESINEERRSDGAARALHQRIHPVTSVQQY